MSREAITSAAGYSGTPLATKLGIKAGATVAVLDEPAGFRDWLAPLPDGVRLRKSLGRAADVVIVFSTDRHTLQRRIKDAAAIVFPSGAVWAGWPKRSSGVATDITEGVVREIALPMGLVDNKVCAISDVWSGLRLVWRRDQRGGPASIRASRSGTS